MIGAALTDLSEALGVPLDILKPWHRPLNEAMQRFGIREPAQQQMFIATLAHESAGFTILREIWGPTPQQRRYERDWSAAWPPTKDDPTNKLAWMLGNSKPGDGRRYAGHGPIQITGRTNHQRVSNALDVDFLATPELLCTAEYGAPSAAWFWSTHGCNEAALLPDHDTAFKVCTKRVNGGLTHLDRRIARLQKIREVFA